MRRPLLKISALVLLAPIGSCVAPNDPPPAPPVAIPAPAPAPAPAPTPTPPPPPRSAEWRDWPVTPGTWSWRRDTRGTIALYGTPGVDAELTLRCDPSRGRLFLSRRGGTAPARITVRTTSTLRTLDMVPTGAVPAYLAAELGAHDNLVDAMGFSRGKIVVQGGGLPDLVLPSWAEILRVAEDCRG